MSSDELNIQKTVEAYDEAYLETPNAFNAIRNYFQGFCISFLIVIIVWAAIFGYSKIPWDDLSNNNFVYGIYDKDYGVVGFNRGMYTLLIFVTFVFVLPVYTTIRFLATYGRIHEVKNFLTIILLDICFIAVVLFACWFTGKPSFLKLI
jgi:hypothetical protein